MQELRKDRRDLRSKILSLLPREDYKISHVYQLIDMRKCGKILKPRMSRHARFWVASSGFRIIIFFYPKILYFNDPEEKKKKKKKLQKTLNMLSAADLNFDKS